MSGGLDWPGLMRLGLQHLRLRPADFWALTPAELALIAGESGTASRPMVRARLDALLARFPDRARDDERSEG
ncbi:rcc01693 family protein [Thioclava atlantica]|uniref:Phage tail assembly chaperone n=1 Tax=Thioclava atlantica TaxID=1317124 RepID=A0A085U037_9RHOB|nr:rcc01693 family protein [Thioclava atlantica]KFE36334.1 hypothetical protein DW2_03459 [Thioclava atlantica]